MPRRRSYPGVFCENKGLATEIGRVLDSLGIKNTVSGQWINIEQSFKISMVKGLLRELKYKFKPIIDTKIRGRWEFLVVIRD